MNNMSSGIFSISTNTDFEKIALDTFYYQAKNNKVYEEYLSIRKIVPENIKQVSEIPFLPISFFKTHVVTTKPGESEIIFSSSGTTGENTSKHYVHDINLYSESFLTGFNKFYGNIEDYCIIALLPSYLEREGSSLIYMVKELIHKSRCSDSGFFLDNYNELSGILKKYRSNFKKVILLGVSFALLDFGENFPIELYENIIVMETGGMKGRRKEITREELHKTLCKQFGKSSIHSEYGMTELLSQAYSKGDGIYLCPPWMRIVIRDLYDPFSIIENGKAGGINVIDLANMYSCSFIETQDIGKLNSDGSFEVLGRLEGSQLRGCNLLVE
jgi:phenylacetate-coenzyme A ligase PaaK-like adenylate-forming protein